MYRIRRSRTGATFTLVCALVFVAAAYTGAQDGAKTVADGVYTDVQAARGATEERERR